MDLGSQLGVSRWVTSGWKIARYYDVRANCAIEVRSRVAFGRMKAGMALEFIQVDRNGPVPMVWDIHDSAASPHLAYWAEDTRRAAALLMASGCQLLMARASTPEIESLRAPVSEPKQLPAALDTCYLSSPAGFFIELVPVGIYHSRLPATFGPDVPKVIPAPDATSSVLISDGRPS
jgi:hypothetical protein